MKSTIKTILTRYKQAIVTFIMLLIVADVLLLGESSDIRIFGILGMYIASIVVYRLTSVFTFIVTMVVLVLMYVQFLVSGTSQSTEKAAVWLFFLLGLGIIQRLKE